VQRAIDPRIAAAFTAEARAAALAALDIDRWADEGGSFDAEAVAPGRALARPVPLAADRRRRRQARALGGRLRQRR
jgi:hypothetical protein